VIHPLAIILFVTVST